MKIIYQDEIGMVELEITVYPEIRCDGQYLLFTDDNDKDYKIPCTDVFAIGAEWGNCYV